MESMHSEMFVRRNGFIHCLSILLYRIYIPFFSNEWSLIFIASQIIPIIIEFMRIQPGQISADGCVFCPILPAFGDWELQFVLNLRCHLSQHIFCTFFFVFFFRFILTVTKLPCGIVYKHEREHILLFSAVCLMIFCFLCAHFTFSFHHRNVFFLFCLVEIILRSLFCSAASKRGWPFGGRYFYFHSSLVDVFLVSGKKR